MLNKNTKVKVRSPDADIDCFEIEAGVLQGFTLSQYLFIVVCLDYMLRTSIDKMKDNDFKLANERSRRYPAKTIMDADYAKGIALLANIPTKSEALPHSLEKAAGVIGHIINTDKSEYVLSLKRPHLQKIW